MIFHYTDVSFELPGHKKHSKPLKICNTGAIKNFKVFNFYCLILGNILGYTKTIF